MAHQVLREPRWPAFVAMLAAAGVYFALPDQLSVGPSWLLLAIIVPLLIPIVISVRRRDHQVTRILTLVANGAITLAMIASLALLVQGIPRHLETPQALLRSAIALWVTNILVFALWYWKLDAGGPVARELPNGMAKSSFLFPQMSRPENHDPCWVPNFVDYLFLAFSTATAFSATDATPLTARAKLLMMLESCISLATLAIVASRAINILG